MREGEESGCNEGIGGGGEDVEQEVAGEDFESGLLEECKAGGDVGGVGGGEERGIADLVGCADETG